MQKITTIAIIATILFSCGETKKETKPEAPKAASIADNPDYQKGLDLISKSDCLTCHKVDEKNIGPAYREIAANYENTEANVKLLAEKIIKGGSGVYGSIPMTPHGGISQADAEQMVKYIFLLKK
jgi:cytochrome c